VSGVKNTPKEAVEEITNEELNQATFRKVFFIADHIDKKSISSKYEDGMLFIKMPKKSERKGETSIIEID
jgi:HSP20 family molecular chaperone IbpA